MDLFTKAPEMRSWLRGLPPSQT